MDCEKLENKAKPMKKRSVQLVREHFEEVLTQLSGFSLFVALPLDFFCMVRRSYHRARFCPGKTQIFRDLFILFKLL